MDFKTALNQRKTMLNRNVLMGILQDCGVSKRTSQIMVVLYECGIMEGIGRSGSVVSSGDVIRFTARLERDYGIAPQFAEEGIRLWAQALGARMPSAPQPKAREQTPPVPAPAPVQPARQQPPVPAPSAAAQEKTFSGSVLTKEDVHRLGWDRAKVVTIPDGVKEIGEDAFWGCSDLVDVRIPESVTCIGKFAFLGCRSLANIRIPEGVNRIETWAFDGCASLVNVHIPGSVTDIGPWGFQRCTSLVNIHIPGSVTRIGPWAFKGCTSLKQVTVPAGCNVNPWAFPEQTQVIRSKAAAQEKPFSGSVLTKEDVHRLGWDRAKVVTIPDGVKEIGDWAFAGCSSLDDVRIPESVTRIGKRAFSGCSRLVDIRIPEGVTCIESETFWWCSSLADIRIPEGVTSIGEGAFAGCTNLINVHIPGSVTSIRRLAFSWSTSLKQITIPAGCTVAWGAFPVETQVIRRK